MRSSLAHAGLSDWTEVTPSDVLILLFAFSLVLVVFYVVFQAVLSIDKCFDNADRRRIEAARRRRGFAVKLTTGDFDGFNSPVPQNKK